MVDLTAVAGNGDSAVADAPSGVSSSAAGADMRSDSVVQEQKQGAHASKAVHTPAAKASKQSKKPAVPDDAESEEAMASRWVRIVSYTIAENKRSLLWHVLRSTCCSQSLRRIFCPLPLPARPRDTPACMLGVSFSTAAMSDVLVQAQAVYSASGHIQMHGRHLRSVGGVCASH